MHASGRADLYGTKHGRSLQQQLEGYRTGFLTFLAITVLRAVINAYRVNVMPVAAAERLPLRQP